MLSFRHAASSMMSVGAGMVRAVPSRNRLEAREPTVGFFVTTDQPFVEMVVATDPALVSAAGKQRRTARNFFASRDHGLLRGPGEITYLLPAAVVASIASGNPRPRRLYYLAVGYADDRANNPVYSTPVDRWPTDLPFVEVADNLHTTSVALAVGMSLDRLTRKAVMESPVEATTIVGVGMDQPQVVWRVESSGQIRGTSRSQAFDEDEEERFDVMQESDEDEDTHGIPADTSAVAHGRGCCAPSEKAQSSEALAYDDGYGPDSVGQWHAEPTELPDDEAGELGTVSYGDEGEPVAERASAPRPTVSPGVVDHVIDQVAATRGGMLFEVARVTPQDGLAFGVLQATQRSGALGCVLQAMHRRDSAAFSRILGADSADLLAAMTSQNEATRMANVGGVALTDDRWRARFQEAGRHAPFAAAQRDLVHQLMRESLVPIARDLGLASTRGLALLLTFVIAFGVNEGLSWVLNGIGPATSPAQRERVLQALRQPDLRAFQRSEGLTVTGELDPRTHARMVVRLRSLAAASPVPVLDPSQMYGALVRQSHAQPFRAKVECIANSQVLDERPV